MKFASILSKIVILILALVFVAIIYTTFLLSNPEEISYGTCAELGRPIVIAEPDWKSAQINTAILELILEYGYGCETEVIPAREVSIVESLINGDMDVTVELKRNTAPQNYSDAIDNGTIVELGVNFIGMEGWYVPRYMVEGDDAPAKGLKRVDQLLEYAPAFFDTHTNAAHENDERLIDTDHALFNNCVHGWFCPEINEEKIVSYGLSEKFLPVSRPSIKDMDSQIAGAIQHNEPWIGYYWIPSEVLTKYDLIKLEETPYSKECWETNKACDFPPTSNVVAVNSEAASELPVSILNVFANFQVTPEMMLNYIHINNFHDAAKLYLMNQQAIWTKWVPEEVARNVLSKIET